MASLTPDDVPGFDITRPLDTDRDVLRGVDRLLDQDSRRQRSLWLMFLSGDSVLLPAVVPIDDVPERPDPELAGNLCGVIADVLAQAAPGGSAVLTLTRPGGETVGDADRRWFRALRSAARERGASIRLLCLATQDGVRPLTVDDAG